MRQILDLELFEKKGNYLQFKKENWKVLCAQLKFSCLNRELSWDTANCFTPGWV